MDPKDVSSRFRLGQVLRKTNKLDEASTVFDDVYAADKNYPGLALERGLLFEQSGDVEKALDQFKSALEKAPNDPDLKLRVGASSSPSDRGRRRSRCCKDVARTGRTARKRSTTSAARSMLQGRMHHDQEAMRHLRSPRAARRTARSITSTSGGSRTWCRTSGSPPRRSARRLELDQTLADGYWQLGVSEFMTGPNENAVQRSPARAAAQAHPVRGACVARAGLRAEEHGRSCDRGMAARDGARGRQVARPARRSSGTTSSARSSAITGSTRRRPSGSSRRSRRRTNRSRVPRG